MPRSPVTQISVLWILGISALFFGAVPFLFGLHFSADDYVLLYGASLKPFPYDTDFRVCMDGVFYRPLSTLSFALNHWLSGWQPWSYYVLNVLLHAINAILVTRFYGHVAPTRRHEAWVAGLLFFVLPQALLNVYWLAGRTDVLCFTGVMSAVLLALHYLRGGRVLFLILAQLGFIFALLSKEAGMLFLLYLALLFVLDSRSGFPVLHRGRVLWLGALSVAVTILYLFLRYSLFDSFLSDPAQDFPMDSRRALMWAVHAVGALFSPLDPVDLMALYHATPLLSAFLVIPVAGFLAMMAVSLIKADTGHRHRVLIIGGAAILSLGVYIKGFPSGRLAYLILPLVIAAVLPLLYASWHRFRALRIFAVLYLCVMFASNFSAVWKFSLLSEWGRSAERAVAGHDYVSDSLIVIGEIGRIGQTFSQLYMPLRYPLALHELADNGRETAFSIAGRFEGNILTDWERPYTMLLVNDTLFLESRDEVSGFVPLMSQKFDSLEPIQQDGRVLHPLAFAAQRGGVLRALKIYPFRGEAAWVVVFEGGVLERMRFDDFSATYGAEGER
jgi:hypothetical protein